MARLLHWGPLFALSIIKFVTLTTLYYLVQWSAPLLQWKSLLNLGLYTFLLASTFCNFMTAIFNGPGYVSLGWRPSRTEDEQFLQFCQRCEGFKAPRSHHCSKCNRCVKKMDHHCPWINSCVGYENQMHFFYFLLSAVIGSIHSSTLLGISLYRAIYFIPNANSNYIYLSVQGLFCILISFGMCLGVIIAVGGLLYIQTRILFRNRTSIEDWIVSKANSRKRDTAFVYPYDLGTRKNVAQVLFEPIVSSDDVAWQVIEGCNKFTLTHEQILQKKEKLDNSSLCRIVKPYNGRFFPLFSQGCRVCLTFPINDDPRLVVNVGDEVLVTHWHKRWLYGQKLNQNTPVPVKGWFPERCAVIVVRPNRNDSDSEDSNHSETTPKSDEISNTGDNKKDK